MKDLCVVSHSGRLRTWSVILVVFCSHGIDYLSQHLQEEVHGKQDEFDDLHRMASQIHGADTRLVSLSTQLNTRYQTAKTSLRVSCSR